MGGGGAPTDVADRNEADRFSALFFYLAGFHTFLAVGPVYFTHSHKEHTFEELLRMWWKTCGNPTGQCICVYVSQDRSGWVGGGGGGRPRMV